MRLKKRDFVPQLFISGLIRINCLDYSHKYFKTFVFTTLTADDEKRLKTSFTYYEREIPKIVYHDKEEVGTSTQKQWQQ